MAAMTDDRDGGLRRTCNEQDAQLRVGNVKAPFFDAMLDVSLDVLHSKAIGKHAFYTHLGHEAGEQRMLLRGAENHSQASGNTCCRIGLSQDASIDQCQQFVAHSFNDGLH